MKKLIFILSFFTMLLMQGCFATIRPIGDGHEHHDNDHHDRGEHHDDNGHH